MCPHQPQPPVAVIPVQFFNTPGARSLAFSAFWLVAYMLLSRSLCGPFAKSGFDALMTSLPKAATLATPCGNHRNAVHNGSEFLGHDAKSQNLCGEHCKFRATYAPKKMSNIEPTSANPLLSQAKSLP
eukprot:209728-Amphidinium_carterae.1